MESGPQTKRLLGFGFKNALLPTVVATVLWRWRVTFFLGTKGIFPSVSYYTTPTPPKKNLKMEGGGIRACCQVPQL